MRKSGRVQSSPWRRALPLLALATLAGTSAAAGAALAIEPAQPTADDLIELLVTVDGNSPCGAAVTLAPFEPGTEQISVLRAFVDMNLSCPASVDLVTVRFRLGKLDPGVHQVLLYSAAFPNDPAVVVETLSFVVAPAGSTENLLLHGGRFELRVGWREPAGTTGVGHVVPGATADSGLFWFFGAPNWELLIKVLDGCGVNGHYWVLGSGATNVEFTLNVRDTLTGHAWTHVNPLNSPAGTWFDTSAFPCVVP